MCSSTAAQPFCGFREQTSDSTAGVQRESVFNKALEHVPNLKHMNSPIGFTYNKYRLKNSAGLGPNYHILVSYFYSVLGP